MDDHHSVFIEVSRTISEVDFDALAAVYHKDALLVTLDRSMPIKSVIEKWRDDAVEAKNIGSRSSLSFRFSNHIHGKDAAFESGIFRYSQTNHEGIEKVFLVHFEILLVNKDGHWLWMMERQKGLAKESEWHALQ
jgi:hypothetical protein